MQGRAESNDRKVVKKAQWQDDPADVPEDWPASVQYLRRPRLSSAVTPDLQKALRTPTRATAGYAKVAEPGSPNPLVRIIPITAPTHPAYGQHGLFATERLPPDSFILTYNGLLHTNDLSDTDLESNYDISMDRELGLSVDATHMGNEARFINDYRRVNEAPNAEFKDVWVRLEDGQGWERRIGVFVLSEGKAGKRKRGIGKGEEVLVSYGKGFWNERKEDN